MQRSLFGYDGDPLRQTSSPEPSSSSRQLLLIGCNACCPVPSENNEEVNEPPRPARPKGPLGKSQADDHYIEDIHGVRKSESVFVRRQKALAALCVLLIIACVITNVRFRYEVVEEDVEEDMII
eukprot:GHVH01016472.1.p1 GENE.GHVH01016472.1~~GHVH01016472.1.p1  ORF type:complete len:124 (-),score=18.48 GHVH01016472.1:68-439(-)